MVQGLLFCVSGCAILVVDIFGVVERRVLELISQRPINLRRIKICHVFNFTDITKRHFEINQVDIRVSKL